MTQLSSLFQSLSLDYSRGVTRAGALPSGLMGEGPPFRLAVGLVWYFIHCDTCW